MRVMKLVVAVSLAGLSLTGCVDDYGGGYGASGYTGGVYGGGVYVGGYEGYDGYYRGYGGGYPYRGRYDRYSDRRWDNRNGDRRENREWQGQQRHDRDRDNHGPRPDRETSRAPSRNYPISPYSPDSCGSPDCRGKSLRGFNR